MKKAGNYEKPEMTVIRFRADETITTASGYIFQLEGYGDELYW